MESLMAAKHELLLEHADAHTDGSRLVMALLRTASLVDRACGTQLAPSGLTEARFAVLLAAAQDDAATPASLAEQLDVSRAAITGLLDGLVRQGLVTRTEHESDRRSLTIAVTASGRSALDALRPVYGDWIGGLTAGIPAEQVSAALDALGAIQRTLTAAEEAAPRG